MPKVSVIIPVYNTEKYLRKCLDSTCNQTLLDIEIICIDDCSTDNSLNILKEYSSKDERIKLIEFKENKGAAVARNLGITEASGEYIAFLDSDDYPEKSNFYERLYNSAIENDADITKGAYKNSDDGFVDETINAKILENKNNFCSTYCSAIFRNDFIKGNSIKFPELRDMEDPVFAFKCALKANKVEVVPECNLIITKRDNSITSKVPTIEQIKDKIKGLKLIFDLGVEKNQSYVLAYWFVTIIKDSLKAFDIDITEYLMYNCSLLFNDIKDSSSIIKEFENIDSTISKYFLENKSYYYFDKEILKKKIDNAKVVSFDIFDTLLLRPFVNPIDVFAYIEKIEDLQYFALNRTIAEKKARLIKQLREKTCEDINYIDIYNKIDSNYKKCFDKEKQLEYQILQQNKEMLEIYNYAKNNNKKIIITSDMYLDRDFLTKILNKNNINGFYKLYVSSEIKLCKGSGNLFKYILNDLNIEAKNLIHIGDNVNSDYKIPKELNINTFCYKKVSERYFNLYDEKLNEYYKNPNTENRMAISSLVGINIIHHFNCKGEYNYWKEIGYKYGGPLGIAYVSSLIKIAKLRNISDIFFIARDGYLFKEIFEKLYNGMDIKSHYVYASRKLNKLYLNSKREDLNPNNEYEKYISSIRTKGNDIIIADTCAGSYSAQSLIEEYLPDKNFIGVYMTSSLNYKYNYINLSSKKNTDYNDLGFLWDFIEFLFTSFELPIENIKDLKPVYRKNINEEDTSKINIYKDVYAGIKLYLNDYLNIFGTQESIYTVLDIFNFIKYFWSNKTVQDNLKLSEVKNPIDVDQSIYLPLSASQQDAKSFYANKIMKSKMKV